MSDVVEFTINGELHRVGKDFPPDTSLNSYIRNYANLRGTKAMCHEGGCGACVVTVASLHPVSKEPHIYAVNSCLVQVFSCQGWAITTVEGLGSKHKGYHPIQTRLAGFNGTQCGYCSPGWVMSMHGLLENNKENLTMEEVEKSFAGNVCRCTGYRPILDAFKTFAQDCSEDLKQKVADIEELSGIKMCQKNNFLCTKSCGDYCSKTDSCKVNMAGPLREQAAKRVNLTFNEGKWFKVYEIGEIFEIFKKEGVDNCSLISGNTAKGVYPQDSCPKVTIDISDVAELKTPKYGKDLRIGGNTTLSGAVKVFRKAVEVDNKFEYLNQMIQHVELIANVPIRNIGTIAGNLCIKHQHRDFPSDLFVLFEAVGAKITIADENGRQDLTMTDFLKTNLNGKIIISITLPGLDDKNLFHSYKIMPCAQNSHAYVNAAFKFRMNENESEVLECSLVYGGISGDFIHATATERYIQGKNIFDREIKAEALKRLAEEVVPTFEPPETSVQYRKKLAVNLFYKFLIKQSINVRLENPEEEYGGDYLYRPVSEGHQNFDTKKEVWPLNKPIAKIEGLLQCSGEAKYVNDAPTMPGEVYGAFVLSTIPGGIIETIDASEALRIKGVMAMFTAKDIPGKNSFGQFNAGDEEIFCSEKVLYNGQVLGMIVAETESLANKAAKLVKITYENVKSNPILTVRQALKAPDSVNRIVRSKKIEPKAERGKEVEHVIKGSFDFYGQYHYTMETQTCVCIPIEDGVDVYPASQWMDHVQVAISEVMNIPEHRINVYVRRLGGAYGAKISRSTQTAAACALAAVKLNRPVRVVLSMQTNMKAVGKRLPYASDYEVGVNAEGKIQYLEYKFYADDGCNHNDAIADHALAYFPNCYDTSSWDVQGFSVLTDTASNTACRSPGTTEGVSMIENVMEHIARVTKRDPLEVKKINMVTEESALPELIDEINKSSRFDERKDEIETFNKNNKWNKKGLSIVPLKYNFIYWGNFYSTVSIYHEDGTVAISHGGIEMGQGLNTKVAQVCAHVLGIDLDKIVIKPSNNISSPNNIVSGGSLASEAVASATITACKTILERLEPIKKDMENPTWIDLIKKAHGAGVDLCAHHMFTTKDDVKPYVIWAVGVCEVEVDFLTGNHQVVRVDILEDTGESLSPQIDVGQVEGAYIMGLGYWTSEKLVYDEETGALLTNRTWNYKPPGARDIPQIMNVSFRRNAPNPSGVLRSKATGEPSLNMTIGVVFAIRQAINSYREDRGKPIDEWCHIEMPCTPENILLAAEAD